jgi:hypothetical protein
LRDGIQSFGDCKRSNECVHRAVVSELK